MPAAGEQRLLTVHAHADDESITMGGTLALLAERGVRTALVTCTDGELATIVDPSMAEIDTRPRLGEIRRAELREACRHLGIGDVHFLGYHDSGMAGADTNQRSEAFWRADLDEVVARLVERIRSLRPHVVVTYDPNGGYGHPDHIQTHRATLLAVEAAADTALYRQAGAPWRVQKLYYTVFPLSVARRVADFAAAAGAPPPFGETAPEELEFVVPDEMVTTVIDCSTTVSRKRAALLAHRSQIGPDFPLVALPVDVQAEHFADEHYRLAIASVPVTLPETDLMAGTGD